MEEIKSKDTNKEAKEEKKEEKTNFFTNLYVKEYKKLMIIPLIILILALAQIGYQFMATGDIMNKGISLKGGAVTTVFTELAIPELEKELKNEFPKNDISVKKIIEAGKQVGVTIEADTSDEDTEKLVSIIEKRFGIDRKEFNIEVTGSSLGKTFYNDILSALGLAFLFMGIVVFLYFRIFVPSIAVILCGFSDIVATLAVTNLLDIKISTAGIVAFLLLIGYSVDTDILLTVRVLKRKEGGYMQSIFSSLKTGLTMTFTTLVAVVVALTFSRSDAITQIMTILLIGLFADLIFTWIQNVGILRLYIEGKEKKND